MNRLISVSGVAVLGAAVGLWKLLDNRDRKCQNLTKSTAVCASLPKQKQQGVPLVINSSSPKCGIKEAIYKSRELIQRTMLEYGIPGAQVAVSKNGRLIWSEGLGLADVENQVPCSPDSVMRIASISKPLTAVGLMQLWEKGLVDLDAPIQNYVPRFPQKCFNGEAVIITTKHLLTHTSGIRHYTKKGCESSVEDDLDNKEYYIATHFDTIEKAIELFAEDELLSKPGKEFHYSTHAWTLVSAVMENVSGEKFLKYMKKNVFTPLGMKSTGGEFHKQLLYHRARHYVRTKKGELKNVRYVDLSYKWAGGGLVSTAQDLVKFGNAVLASYNNSLTHSDSTYPLTGSLYSSNQGNDTKRTKASSRNCSSSGSRIPNDTSSTHSSLLSPEAASLMLTKAVDGMYPTYPRLGYALGWDVDMGEGGVACGTRHPMFFGHSGRAVGASSILLVFPGNSSDMLDTARTGYHSCDSGELSGCVCGDRGNCDSCTSSCEANGVVVCIIFNLQGVRGVFKLGLNVAKYFMS